MIQYCKTQSVTFREENFGDEAISGIFIMREMRVWGWYNSLIGIHGQSPGEGLGTKFPRS